MQRYLRRLLREGLELDYMAYIAWLKGKRDRSSVEAGLGGKGSSLHDLATEEFMVPEGFVVTLEAFRSYLASVGVTTSLVNIAQCRSARKHFSEMQDTILRGEIPVDIVRALDDALLRLEAKHVAVRSSAVTEDTELASFAGIFETILCVSSETDSLSASIKKCWASLFGERALGYLVRKELSPTAGMAVVVQKMIRPEVAGVTFTESPTDKSQLLIEASYGLGTVIADGLVEPDRFSLARKTLKIRNVEIGDKIKMQVCQEGSLVQLYVPEEAAKRSCLTDTLAKDVARLGLSVERYFGCPQDIEWCLRGGQIWVLQSRPICPATG